MGTITNRVAILMLQNSQQTTQPKNLDTLLASLDEQTHYIFMLLKDDMNLFHKLDQIYLNSIDDNDVWRDVMPIADIIEGIFEYIEEEYPHFSNTEYNRNQLINVFIVHYVRESDLITMLRI